MVYLIHIQWTLHHNMYDKIQVAFFQESLLKDSEQAHLNESGFTHVYFSCHGLGMQRGVANLKSSAVYYKHEPEHKDWEGRFYFWLN